MKRLSLILTAACILASGFLGSAWLSAAPTAAAPAVAATAANLPAAVKPAMKDKNRHEQYVALAKKGGIELYFEGDSITDGWHNQKAIWNKEFGSWKPANFGIGGDQTQHVLYRLQNGEIEGVNPKAVVLMIGTNNIGQGAENIAAGVTAIVKEFQKQAPEAKILLLAIFPRGEKATDPARAKLKAVNDIIAKLDDGKNIKYLDIGGKFLDADGTLPKTLFPDSLHPNAKGYQIWADAIKPQLTEWLGAPAATAPAAK
jgi:lysophospholipase L1-like esterase